ncbi:hypothetical protein MBLNU230_g3561t1 [Neophaeotheca triangularis]
MSVVGEAVGIVACVAGVINVYREAGATIDQLKKRRADNRAPPPPRLLEESIDQAPDDIVREKQRGLQRFEKAFEDGDHIAVIALQQIAIQLRENLLQKLNVAADGDDIKEFGNLVDAADLGRDRTISTLCELRQRLLTSGPVNNMPTLPVMTTVPPESANAAAPADAPRSTEQVPRLQEQQEGKKEVGPPRKMSTKKHKTWTRDFGASQSTATSGEEDAMSGAEQNQQRAKRTGSLLSMFKHRKNTSKDNTSSNGSSNATAQAVDPPEQGPQPVSPTSMPLRPFRPDDSREVSPTSTGRPQQPPANRSNNYFNFAPDHGGLAESKESENHLSEQENSRPTSPGGTTLHSSNGPLSPATQMSSLANAPSIVRGHASSSTLHSQAPSSTNLASQNPSASSNNHSNAPTSNPSSQTKKPSNPLPHPTSDNHYLNFCKSAIKLQNHDRSALHKRKEFNEPWSSSDTHFLACSSSKCCFAGRIDTSVVWEKVYAVDKLGLKFRWPLLAKSHVPQKYMRDGKYVFQCLLCAYAGEAKPANCLGADKYLAHLAEHRGSFVPEAVARRAGAVVDRVARDDEEWDFCLLPLLPGEQVRKPSLRTSENLRRLGAGGFGIARAESGELQGGKGDTGGFADGGGGDGEDTAHWNEGLSDFRYDTGLEDYRGEI